MKKFLLFAIWVIFFIPNLTAQRGSKKNINQPAQKEEKINWSVNPFEHALFVENKGQFDNVKAGGKILFEAKLGAINAYFTPKGILYRYMETERVDFTKGKDPDQNGPPKRTFYYLTTDWEGGNPDVSVVADQEQPYYYTYPKGNNETYTANVFKKITYKNLYPGIDVVYTFHEGSNNLEYSIVVHPGTSLDMVHLKYQNSKGMLVDAAGNVLENNDIGVLKETAPVSHYLEDHMPVNVSIKATNPDESFVAGELDVTKTLLIDPTIQWDSIPNFTGGSSSDEAFDLDYDNYGNVYVYGGGPTIPQVIKLNSLGATQWVFNATTMTSSTNYFGDFAVDKHSEQCYTVEGWNAGGGARILKISPLGALIATDTGNPLINEMWKIKATVCLPGFVIFGGSNMHPYQAEMLDTTMSSLANPANILNDSTGYHDVVLAAIDPSGGFAYVATCQSLVYTSVLNNYLLQVPIPALTPFEYSVPDHFGFQEIGSIFYTPSYTFNAMNGMACSQSWLYAYNGDTIKQVNKVTGNIVRRKQVSTTPYAWGGLDVDLCGNVYAAIDDSICIYGPNLNFISSLPVLSGTIYDLAVNPYPSDLVYACGQNFVASITYNSVTPSPSITFSTLPTSCSICNGSATASLTFCGNPDTVELSYQWSDGETTRTADSLCAGMNTVTVTPACGLNYVDSVLIPTGIRTVTSNISDSGSCNGSAWVTPATGTAPYTYSWSPGGETTDTVSGLCAGTYCCNIKDALGCSSSVCITVVHPCLLASSIHNTSDSDFCDGNAWITVSSGVAPYTYLWSAGGQTQDSIGNLCSGTFCCIISDASGCQDTLCTNLISTCVTYNPTLCYVTCDTTSLHNLVVWQKTGLDSTKVDSFVIYRGVTSSIYDRIGAVSIHDYTSFIDTGSNPNITSYDYKLGLSETCGTDTVLSAFQQTVLLQTTRGLGGDTVNLSWDYYEGATVDYYRILRDDSGTGNWQVLDSVPGSVIAYTDLSAPINPGLRYMLNINWISSCTPYIPRRSIRHSLLNILDETYSNIRSAIPTAVGQITKPISVEVYPNPTDNELYISLKSPFGGIISLCDILGRQIYSMNVSSNGGNTLEKINVDSYSSGVYFLKIETNKGQRIIKKVVKI